MLSTDQEATESFQYNFLVEFFFSACGYYKRKKMQAVILDSRCINLCMRYFVDHLWGNLNGEFFVKVAFLV